MSSLISDQSGYFDGWEKAAKLLYGKALVRPGGGPFSDEEDMEEKEVEKELIEEFLDTREGNPSTDMAEVDRPPICGLLEEKVQSVLHSLTYGRCKEMFIFPKGFNRGEVQAKCVCGKGCFDGERNVRRSGNWFQFGKNPFA
jgi:hypothetical protein